MTPAATNKKVLTVNTSNTGFFSIKPGGPIAVCARDFGRRIQEKYRLAIISLLRRPRLTLRQMHNPVSVNRFIRFLLQNKWTHQIRLPSVKLHLTTILHPRPLSPVGQRPGVKIKSTCPPAQVWRSDGILGMLQMWLNQARLLSVGQKERSYGWPTSFDPIISKLSDFGALLDESHKKTKAFTDFRPLSLNFGRLDSGRSSGHRGIFNRVLQNFSGRLFGRPLNVIVPPPAMGSSDGHRKRLMPVVGSEPSIGSKRLSDEMFPKTIWGLMNRPIRTQTDFPATTIRGDRYNSGEDTQEQNTSRQLASLSHLALKPFSHWPDRLIDIAGREALRESARVTEKKPKPSPMFADKRTIHLTDKSGRERPVFSACKPVKITLAVSEKKAVADFNAEFQNIKRQLETLKPAEKMQPHIDIDIHQLSEKVYDEIGRKLRIERERRGL